MRSRQPGQWHQLVLVNFHMTSWPPPPPPEVNYARVLWYEMVNHSHQSPAAPTTCSVNRLAVAQFTLILHFNWLMHDRHKKEKAVTHTSKTPTKTWRQFVDNCLGLTRSCLKTALVTLVFIMTTSHTHAICWHTILGKRRRGVNSKYDVVKWI